MEKGALCQAVFLVKVIEDVFLTTLCSLQMLAAVISALLTP